MTIPRMTVLVVGATGSIGCLVVEEALRQGHAVRALVRTPGKARRLPPRRRCSAVTSPAPTRFPVRWTVSTLSCSPYRMMTMIQRSQDEQGNNAAHLPGLRNRTAALIWWFFMVRFRPLQDNR